MAAEVDCLGEEDSIEDARNLVRAGEYDEALKKLKSVVRTCDYILTKIGNDDIKRPEYQSFRLAAKSNIALCQMKQECFGQASETLKAILKDEPNHIKSLFRMARCQQKLGYYIEAISSLDCLDAAPVKNDFVNAVQLLRREINADSKEESQNMRIIARAALGPTKSKDQGAETTPSYNQILARCGTFNTRKMILGICVIVLLTLGVKLVH